VLSEAASRPRLVFWSASLGAGPSDDIAAWLAEHTPDAIFSLAELANPAREEGHPVLVIAVEAHDPDELERIRARFVEEKVWGAADTRFCLHLATR
jgi:hypothetical protein